MKERNQRLSEEELQFMLKKNRMSVKVEPEADALEDQDEERARKIAQLKELNEGRLRDLFEKCKIQKAKYD